MPDDVLIHKNYASAAWPRGLRSVYTERDRGFAAFAKEWSK